MTWKQQTEKAETREKARLAVMKKLAGTTWGVDAGVLKKMYTGRIRPVLEYGVTAWGTAAKSNFEKVSKVQNQAFRVITGAMKSTPIQELESITGLESLEDRRDTKLLKQAAKFKRLPDHPMHNRLTKPTKGRLKRGSFVHQTRILERRHQELLDQDPNVIPGYLDNPSWSEDVGPSIQCSVPGVGPKDSQSSAAKKALTLAYIEEQYPSQTCTQI